MASTSQMPLLNSKPPMICHLDKQGVETSAGLYLQDNLIVDNILH